MATVPQLHTVRSALRSSQALCPLHVQKCWPSSASYVGVHCPRGLRHPGSRSRALRCRASTSLPDGSGSSSDKGELAEATEAQRQPPSLLESCAQAGGTQAVGMATSAQAASAAISESQLPAFEPPVSILELCSLEEGSGLTLTLQSLLSTQSAITVAALMVAAVAAVAAAFSSANSKAGSSTSSGSQPQPVSQPAAGSSSSNSGSSGNSATSSSTALALAPAEPSSLADLPAPMRVWSHLVLSSSYVHSACTSFAIPVMLPMISASLALTDWQGAMLTAGYSYLYAAALVPMGLLADRLPRPKLLGLGVAAWSGLALAASHANSFAEMMIIRVGFAAAQSAQNVVSFSVIPDLYPKNRATALALYNCAIYVGRGLMYHIFNSGSKGSGAAGAVGAAASSIAEPHVTTTAAEAAVAAVEGGGRAAGMTAVFDSSGNLLVPMDKLDLRLVQIVYTNGDIAAIRTMGPAPSLSPANIIAAPPVVAPDFMWRDVLSSLTLPGLVIAGALLATIPERRKAASGTASSTSGSTAGSVSGLPALAAAGAAAAGGGAQALTAATEQPAQPQPQRPGLLSLLRTPPFMATTLAASFNDVASYALIAWQSTLYERVYGLTAASYAPVLATLLPVGGILGGVGGGLLADRLARHGKRSLVTVGASLLAVPALWWSVSAPSAEQSFAALGIGFALSEAWRAPAAVMARGSASPELGATTMSVYLCVRHIIGGFGPLLVSALSEEWGGGLGLQSSLQMMLPLMYLISSACFVVAEKLLAEKAAADAAAAPSSTPASSAVSSASPLPASPPAAGLAGPAQPAFATAAAAVSSAPVAVMAAASAGAVSAVGVEASSALASPHSGRGSDLQASSGGLSADGSLLASTVAAVDAASVTVRLGSPSCGPATGGPAAVAGVDGERVVVVEEEEEKEVRELELVTASVAQSSPSSGSGSASAKQ